MTAQELKMAAWEMDATASALAVNLVRHVETLEGWDAIIEKIEAEVASLQAYAHVLQAEAAKEGAA